MQGNSYLPDCNDDDVFSFESSTQSAMFKVDKFRQAVRNAFQEHRQLADTLSEFLKSQGIQIDTGGKWVHKTFYTNNLSWFNEGIDCEVLKLGSKNWQKGKVKIRINLEFCSDEVEIVGDETLGEINSNDTKNQIESPLDDIRRMINQDS